MNRRGFLGLLAGAAATKAVTYFLPPIGGWHSDVIAHALWPANLAMLKFDEPERINGAGTVDPWTPTSSLRSFRFKFNTQFTGRVDEVELIPIETIIPIPYSPITKVDARKSEIWMQPA